LIGRRLALEGEQAPDISEVSMVAGESIAGEGIEIGFFGEEIEGRDHVVGVGVDGLVPHLVFERPDAELAPVGEDHAIHAVALGGGGGLEKRKVVLVEGVEVAAGFIFEESDAGLTAATTVAKCVAG
jgi:hypothetical protein